MIMRRYDSVLSYGIPLFISLALCISLGYQGKQIALKYRHNKYTFLSYEQGVSGYSLPKEWRTRLFSNYLASLFVPSYLQDGEVVVDDEPFRVAVGRWAAFWLLLTNLTFIIGFGKKSLWFLFGTYAAVSFGYMPGITARIYPWDMPILWFFSLFVLIIYIRQYYWLLLLIPIATGFKETALVVSLSFLFWEKASLRKRLALFSSVLLASFIVKASIDAITNNPAVLYTMTTQTPDEDLLIIFNLQDLLKLRLNHPIFINAGLLLSFLLIPIRNREMLLLKAITVCFVIGIFVWGIVYEYRIWFELIPVSLYGLYLYFFPRSGLPHHLPLLPRKQI